MNLKKTLLIKISDVQQFNKYKKVKKLKCSLPIHTDIYKRHSNC